MSDAFNPSILPKTPEETIAQSNHEQAKRLQKIYRRSKVLWYITAAFFIVFFLVFLGVRFWALTSLLDVEKKISTTNSDIKQISKITPITCKRSYSKSIH